MLLFTSTQDENVVAERRRETGVVHQANSEHLRPSCRAVSVGKCYICEDLARTTQPPLHRHKLLDD